MITQGNISYKIGRKVRFMRVDQDAEILWQICVREIYVLMKHYNEKIEDLRKAFENVKIITTTTNPSKRAIDKCAPFTKLNIINNSWKELMINNQHSFINILETGYFLNDGEDIGLVIMLDFNINSVILYNRGEDKKIKIYENTTITEIMKFNEMPTKSLTEIVSFTKDRYKTYTDKIKSTMIEINKIQEMIEKTKKTNDNNIQEQLKKLKETYIFEKQKLELDYRYFYHRLDALELIDYNC